MGFQSFLYYKGRAYVKKNGADWDVSMGSCDSAECADLVGLYILSKLNHLPIQNGIYKVDGISISDLTQQQTENIKKEICQIFRNLGLKIKIECNKKVVNYLDVTLDLFKSEHRPFRKENNTPIYVNAMSNHPPAVKKALPLNVNKRLNALSSNEMAFNNAAPLYQDALRKAGYSHELKYEKIDLIS